MRYTIRGPAKEAAMTICQTLNCKACGIKFHATYDEDESFPDECPDCVTESDGELKEPDAAVPFDPFMKSSGDQPKPQEDWDDGMFKY
jgi:hypothetical protein